MKLQIWKKPVTEPRPLGSGHLRIRLRILGITSIAFTVSTAMAATCDSLATLTLPGTTITTAESVPAGSFTPPGGQPIKNLPAFCRVAGILKPTSDSDIQFEVWLPTSGWNGKF